MSQRTIPSMSFGVSPASSIAASAAWVASVRSLRPELREKSVAPMPTIAHRSRWWSSAHHTAFRVVVVAPSTSVVCSPSFGARRVGTLSNAENRSGGPG